MNAKVVAPLLSLVLIPLAACGGSSGSSATAPADADVVVRAKDGLRWDKTNYTASAADGTIKFFGTNDSGLTHNLHIQDADGNDVGTPIDLPSKGSNGTDELTLAPGTYTIVCKIPGHSATMTASLTVTG